MLLIAGCQPVKPANPRGDPLAGLSAGDPSGQTTSADQVLKTDPCGSRLHDVGGALLMYYALNKHMPEQLEEVKSMADFGMELVFTCPKSGKPYSFTPNGLAAIGKDKRIVIYDSEPSHDGRRWCVFMPTPRLGQAMSLEVLLVPEGLFNTYTVMP